MGAFPPSATNTNTPESPSSISGITLS
jgi:hypothetical protein